MAHLFETRNALDFPDEAMVNQIRLAVRDEIRERIREKGIEMTGEPEILHLASLSPVANSAWIFWERGRLLIRYTSQFDLGSPLAWRHPEHAVTVYDLTTQVVVSLHEVPGSNAYFTRDMVARALFNCVVLGKRIELIPDSAE